MDLAAYHQIQPFGAERDNWHMATQASMFAAAHTPKGKRRPSVKDFMWVDPISTKQKETQTFFSRLSAKAKKHADR